MNIITHALQNSYMETRNKKTRTSLKAYKEKNYLRFVASVTSSE